MDHRIAVLVVEDEALIRIAVVSELEDAGYKVLGAENATAAILILLANSHIEVMFTDIDMPGGVDGLKLAAAVADRWPPIKIVVTSGYQTIDMHTLPVESIFLKKPYNTTEVIDSIQDLMAA
jgi:two-component system, response regulator PdtaR